MTLGSPEKAGLPGRLGITALIGLFILRILLVLFAGRPWNVESWTSWTMEPDSHTYLALASDISDGVQDSVSTRTPGYPALLAAFSALEPGSTLPVVLLQQIADLATALLIGAMTAGTGCRHWWTASACWLLLPAAAATSSRILPDTLLATVSAAVCLLWLKWASSPSHRRLAAAYGGIGLLLSAGALIKPVFLFAPAVFVIMIPFTKVRSFSARAAAVLLMLLVFSAGSLVWRIHNRDSFGMDAISAQDGYEQAGRIWVLTGRATQMEFLTSVRDSVDSLSSVDGRIDYDLRSRIYRHMAMDELRRHPAAVIVPHLSSWPRFFSTGVGNTMRYLGLARGEPAETLLKAASALFILSIPAGFALGVAVRQVRRKLGVLLPLAGAWMVVMAIVHGPLAGPRYGLTFLPVLCAAGIASLCLLTSSWRETRTKGTSAQ